MSTNDHVCDVRPESIATLRRQCGSVEEGTGRKSQDGIQTKCWESSFIKEIIENRFIRFKFILSILVIFAKMILGYNRGQIGPAFPDLMEITNTDLEKGSTIMTSYFSGRLVGSGLGGILFSKMNIYLMFVVSLVINGAVVAAIPWCSSYELMMTAHALHGISGGVLDIAITSTSMPIWGSTARGRSYIQILHVFLAASLALAPIGTAPFLREKGHVSDNENITRTAQTSLVSHSNNTVNASSFPESTLYIAYSISSGITILVSVPFMILYITSVTDSRRQQKSETCNFLGNLPRIVNYLQFINIGVFSGLFSVIDLCFPAYLTVFCVQYLNWKKTSGAMVTSLLLFATMGGRVVGIFLVRVMKSHTILLSSTVLYTLGFICMTVSAHLHSDFAIWISVCIIGLALGITWPSTLNWINSYLVPVGGKVSSYILVVSFLCTLFCPSLLGNLMQQVSLLWFCYICLIASAFNVICTAFMVLHTIFFNRNRNTHCLQISTIR